MNSFPSIIIVSLKQFHSLQKKFDFTENKKIKREVYTYCNEERIEPRFGSVHYTLFRYTNLYQDIASTFFSPYISRDAFAI